MKQLAKIGCVLISLLLVNTVAAFEKENQIYAQLLLTGNAQQAKMAAQTIFNKKIKDQALTDVAAEALAQSFKFKLDFDPDTQAWLVKALGQTGSRRYQMLFDKDLYPETVSKVRRHMSSAMDNLSSKPQPSYEIGSIDLRALAQSIKKSNLSNAANIDEQQFASIRPGHNINRVVKLLGLPSKVGSTFGHRRQTWVGTISFSLLQLDYGNAGAITFHFHKEVHNWTVRDVKVGLVKNGKGLDDFADHPLVKDDLRAAKVYLQKLFNEANATELDLDLAAELAWAKRDTEGAGDTVAWACKLIGSSSRVRYRGVIQKLLDTTSSRKIRKYAKWALNRLPAGKVEQYQLGDVHKDKNEAI